METERNIIRRLELEYLRIYEAMGFSRADANSAAQKLVAKAREESAKKGWADFDADKLLAVGK